MSQVVWRGSLVVDPFLYHFHRIRSMLILHHSHHLLDTIGKIIHLIQELHALEDPPVPIHRLPFLEAILENLIILLKFLQVFGNFIVLFDRFFQQLLDVLQLASDLSAHDGRWSQLLR